MGIRNQIVEQLIETGLFSEYLPKEFSSVGLKNRMFSKSKVQKNIPPIMYSMNKFDSSNHRRYIYIPEINNYLLAIERFSQGRFIENVLDLVQNNQHSFSKILKDNNNALIREFHLDYPLELQNIDKTEISEFITNVQQKIKLSAGATSIVRLDIANFYGSFYMHNISAIGEGAKWAQSEFEKNDAEKSEKYRYLKSLDKAVSQMNLGRTHGLLTGPKISFILAESILSTIDKEIKHAGIKHVRFVDDYDIFIFNDNEIAATIATINRILNVYGFTLNDSKTEIKKFPFYAYQNFDFFLPKTDIALTNEDILNLYSKFVKIEQNNEQNGSLYFLCSKITQFINANNKEIIVSLLLSILRNVPKTITLACQSIIKYNQDDKAKVFEILQDFLQICIDSNFDLECIWILYTLLKINKAQTLEYICTSQLLEKLNELCLVEFVCEGSIDETLINKLKVLCSKHNWLLNYECFRLGYISEEELKNNLKIENIDLYNLLKEENISFYHIQ